MDDLIRTTFNTYVLRTAPGGVFFDTINYTAQQRVDMPDILARNKKQADKVRAFVNALPPAVPGLPAPKGWVLFRKHDIWQIVMPEAKETSAGRTLNTLVHDGFLVKMPAGDIILDGHPHYDAQYDYSVMGPNGVKVRTWRKRHPNDLVYAPPGPPYGQDWGTWIGYKNGGSDDHTAL